MKKKLLVLLVTALTMVMLAACGSSKSTTGDKGNNKETSSSPTTAIGKIKEHGKLRVAIFSDKPPFGYVDSKGKNQGYDVVLAKRLAKDLLGDESKLEYVITEPQARVDLLKSDKVDIVLANFTVTPERQEQVDFANPYMKVAIGVVSPDSAPIKSVNQLKGKKLIVPKGTTAETYFMKNYPDIELVKYDSITDAFAALKDGRGDAMTQDNALLFAWANSNPGFSVGITSLGETGYIAPAVKKGNGELLKWLNNELETLGKGQFFHKAYDKTLKPAFGENISADDVVVEGKAN